MNVNKCIVTLCAQLSFLCSSCAQAFEPLFPCTEKLEAPYGICCHVTRYEYDMMDDILEKYNDIGATSMRTDWDWGRIEPKVKSEYKWAVMDKVYSDTHNSKIDLLPIINEDTWNNEHAWDFIPHWKEYIKASAERHHTVDHWEICNEIDLSKSIPKDSIVSTYRILLHEANSSLKQLRPTNKTVFSGVASVTSELGKKLMSSVSSDDYDIMNFHMYTGWGGPERFIDTLKIVSDMMARYDCVKPLWITETGYSTYRNANIRGYETHDVQSEYIARTYLICLSLGVDRVYWYQFGSTEENPDEREHHWGLVHNNLKPKESYRAYKALTSFLPSGSTRPVLTYNGNYYKAEWMDVNGRRSVALWVKDGECVLPREFKRKGTAYDMYGNKLSKSRLKIKTGVTYIICGR